MHPFDTAAGTYDDQFTNSRIGRILRKGVWNYMERVLAGTKKINILELNCGTGEDALFFARKGHRVTATDVSEEMIKRTNEKIKKAGLQNSIETKKMDARELRDNITEKTFDLVFSNFGGLNCIERDQLVELSAAIADCLNHGGRFIGVIMGKVCLWESLYFLARLDLDKVFRRNTSDRVAVRVNGRAVDTWYYDPAEFTTFFKQEFRKVNLRPLGFFIPPSYMENAMARHENILSLLDKMETAITSVPVLAYFADHYIIDLEKT